MDIVCLVHVYKSLEFVMVCVSHRLLISWYILLSISTGANKHILP